MKSAKISPNYAAAACLILGWTLGSNAWGGEGQVDPGVLSEIVLFPTLFSAVAFLVWVLAAHRQRQTEMRLRHELRLKVLERLTVAPDVAALLAGEQGASFVQVLTGGERRGTRRGIVGTVMSGIILVAVGGGLAIIATTVDLGARAAFSALAIIVLALGCGFLLAAFAAWRLTSQIDGADALSGGPPDREESGSDI